MLTYNASLPFSAVVAYFVAGHILSSATIYVYVHGTFCCWQQYMSMFMAHFVAGNNICLCSWHILLLATIYVYVHGTFCCWQQYMPGLQHILSPIGTYCHWRWCMPQQLCVSGREGRDRQTERERDRQGIFWGKHCLVVSGFNVDVYLMYTGNRSTAYLGIVYERKLFPCMVIK